MPCLTKQRCGCNSSVLVPVLHENKLSLRARDGVSIVDFET